MSAKKTTTPMKASNKSSNFERERRIKKVGHAPHHIKHKKAIYNLDNED